MPVANHKPIEARRNVPVLVRPSVDQAQDLKAERVRADSPWRIALRMLVRNRVAMAGFGVLVLVSLAALFAPPPSAQPSSRS